VALNDQRRLGLAYAAMGQYSWLMGDQDRYIELTQRALAIAEALGDFDIRVRATYYLGGAYQTLGDYSQAIDYLRRLVVFLERAPFWKAPGSSGPTSVVARLYLSWSLAEVGAFAEGSARAEEALRIAEAAEVTFSRIAAYLALGLVALRQGVLDRAIAMLEQGLGLCQSANIPFWFPRVGSALGFAYILTGRVAEGLPLLEQAVTQGVAMGQMVFQPLWVAYLAEAYLVSGRLEDAMVHGERAVALARKHKERGHEPWALRLLGDIAAQHKPPEVEQAEAHYHQALALAEALGMRPLQAHCHCGLGTLYAKIGGYEQARTELSAAIALYRAMEMRFWLPQAEAALAQVEER
jgi:tetratricopeptide (TPR) repeat protein